jgi:hypothetical protein
MTRAGLKTNLDGTELLELQGPAGETTTQAIADLAGGGGGSAGSPIVRAFPFAFDTPNLVTGATIYSPAVGELLLDAWIEIDTPWDGTTPKGDLGGRLNASFPAGIWGAYTGEPLDMTKADDFNASSELGDNLFSGNNLGPLSTMAGIATPSSFEWGLYQVSGANVDLIATPTSSGARIVPIKFTGVNPLKVIVSVDGFSLRVAFITASLPTLPTTVVANSNDEFGFGPNGSEAVYTVAPGTYTTIDQLRAAMNNATKSGGAHLSDLVTITNDDSLFTATATTEGSAFNGYDFTTGTHDFLAATGFANGATLSNGKGGDPGSTQGVGIVYLVTATPV